MKSSGRRVILIVLDGAGVGAMPDAAKYNDAGTNTIAHVAKTVPSLHIPHLVELGLHRIVSGLSSNGGHSPAGAYGRLRSENKAKDTICGHWEIAGIVQDPPFCTYPHGFPTDLVNEWCNRCGIAGALGNKTASGTVIIEELGEEHLRTGLPILYTSADSVFQIAAHEEIIPLPRLYEMCLTARNVLKPPHLVARVIARPFIGKPGSFKRTGHRRDFAVPPPGPTLLDLLQATGMPVIAIGKIDDIFCKRGITQIDHTTNNRDAIETTLRHARDGYESALIFTNLGDFDTLYGHRRDPKGFAEALEEFDGALPHLIGSLRNSDILMITADHGCDPTWPYHTDHTREEVPVLVAGPCVRPEVCVGTRESLSDISATILEAFGLGKGEGGKSFWKWVTAS
jgi:phosphopentomutase